MKRGVSILLGLLALVAACGAGLFFSQRETLRAPKAEGFTAVLEEAPGDLRQAAEGWLAAYTQRYRSVLVPAEQRVKRYTVSGAEQLEDGVVLLDFAVETAHLSDDSATAWNGSLGQGAVECHWVLFLSHEQTGEGAAYTADQVLLPAGYDLYKYAGSGQAEQDQYEAEHNTPLPYEKTVNTYRIREGVCEVSLDAGASWSKVPVPSDTLTKVGDGASYTNQLTEGAFVISQEIIAIAYGGTEETPLSVVSSADGGETWTTAVVDEQLTGNRLKFLSFPTAETGFLVATGGRTMSQEGQAVYRTTDGGKTWEKTGEGPKTNLLSSACFLTETLGFMSYPPAHDDKGNTSIRFFRTADGGATWEAAQLPMTELDFMGTRVTPFLIPGAPYEADGALWVEVFQDDSGDYKGGRTAGKYQSTDEGKTWSFVEEFEPSSDEPG